MNSIFSSFDVVCAEILGQRRTTVKASFLACDLNKRDGAGDKELKTVTKSDDSSMKEGNPSPSPSPPPLPPSSTTFRRRQQLQKPTARFAPELDGVVESGILLFNFLKLFINWWLNDTEVICSLGLYSSLVNFYGLGIYSKVFWHVKCWSFIEFVD
ncbi:hypothetical protein U1Q18_019885 [Sarracenia purpurea var. burkii]